MELPGVFLHDQTGNPVETTVDLRGFLIILPVATIYTSPLTFFR